MATLAEFLKTGSLGPLVLGMDPVDAIAKIGDPEEESQKRNPLTLEYGSLRLVFWKHGSRSQLRDISLYFLPEFRQPPPPIALEDFKPDGPATYKYLQTFVRRIKYPPAHIQESVGQQMVFLSGVVADFVDGLLHIIRLSQKHTKESLQGPLSDAREPSREQIVEMIHESERALGFGARRSALIMAWAALEASLRRVALRWGLRGQIGVQPTVLIREMISRKVLSPKDAQRLERFRQFRTATVHGLAPMEFQPRVILEMNGLSKRLLKRSEVTIR